MNLPTMNTGESYAGLSRDHATGEPGAIVLELDADELGRGWREFHALLALWRATNLEEVTPC